MPRSATQLNVQLTITDRDALPDLAKTPGGSFCLARDTKELFVCNRDPAGIEPPSWDLVSTEAINVKGSVLTASDAPLPAYVAEPDMLTGDAPGVLTVGGIMPPIGARVLVKDEPGALAANDGIFDVIFDGDLISPYVLKRADDAIQGLLVSGSFVFVEKGTLASTGWLLRTPDPIIVGTTLQDWVQFSGAGTYTATAPIVLTGTDFSLAGTDVAADGTVQHFTLASDADAGGKKIENVDAPAAGGDAANKTYVDAGDAATLAAAEAFATAGDVATLAAAEAYANLIVGPAIRELRIPIGIATVDSTALIPANAQITECTLKTTTAYTGGTTISVGSAGSPALLQTTTDNLPSQAIVGGAPNFFTIDQDTSWGGVAGVVRVTIAGAASGAGFVIVKYSIPGV